VNEETGYIHYSSSSSIVLFAKNISSNARDFWETPTAAALFFYVYHINSIQDCWHSQCVKEGGNKLDGYIKKKKKKSDGFEVSLHVI
jgi:hypothetical protein